MSERSPISVDIKDSDLRKAVTKFIENINVLMEPVVKAVRTESGWSEICRAGEEIPGGWRFLEDKEPREAWLRVSAIYNDREHVGKITIDVVDASRAFYLYYTRSASILVSTLYTKEPEMVYAQAQRDFREKVEEYCKPKNAEVQP